MKLRLLLIHGFGGSIDEVAPLAKFLAKKGYLVNCPPLKGHTGLRKDIKGTTHHDWIASAEHALLELREKDPEPVMVVGFSMGGLIALNLALRFPVTALATINTPIYFWDLKQVALNLVDDFKTGEYTHLKHYLRSSGNLPVTSMLHFRSLLTQTKPLIARITQPILVLQANDDDAVRPKSANYIYDHTGSSEKQLAFFDHSGHAMLHSPAAAPAMERIAEFICQVEEQI